MKRFHVHVAVTDLDQSIAFYSSLFGAEPSVTKVDYAKWMLDDPRINFAISSEHHAATGVEHLGIQAEDEGELADVYGRLEAAGRPVLEEGATTCCYAKSEKSWISDPDGVVWEAFHKAFRTAYLAMQRRIRLFLALPLESIDEMSLLRKINDIGHTADERATIG